MAWTKNERKEAVLALREIVKPGDTVYVSLKHVSRSGMLRVIQPFIIQEGRPRHIGYLAAKAIDLPYDRNKEGVRIGGCGMDMGFALVYDLSRVLFPEGFKVDGRGRNGDMSGWDKDGGYALRKEWL